MSYCRILLTPKGSGSFALGRGRLGDDLGSIDEFNTCDQLWQLVVTIEAAPAVGLLYLRRLLRVPSAEGHHL
jgi:hypothetical protein